MNIFVIPTWYPSAANPIQGSFIKEQILCYLRDYPDSNFFISLWGQESSFLSLRHPMALIKSISKYMSSNAEIKEQKGYTEFYTPEIFWSERISSGGLERLVDVNKKHLLMALERCDSINVIHAHVGFPAGYIAYRLSKEFDIPYIITEHMGPFPFPEFIRNGELIENIRLAYSNSSYNVVVSEFMAEELKSHKIKNVEVIPNFVDENVFFPDSVKNDSFIFMTVCGFYPIKGLDILLKAISEIKNENFLCLIIGEGELSLYYKKLAVKLNINSKIRWVGRVSRAEIKNFFNLASCIVSPSHYESFGITLAEAIACGKPIIATKSGGPEMIVNEVNGLLVDRDNPSQLANAMLDLQQRYEYYSPQLIRSDFLNRFSSKIINIKWENMYYKVCNQ